MPMAVDFPPRSAPAAQRNRPLDLQVYAAQRLVAVAIGLAQILQCPVLSSPMPSLPDPKPAERYLRSPQPIEPPVAPRLCNRMLRGPHDFALAAPAAALS